MPSYQQHETTTGRKKHPRPVAPRPSGPLRNGAKRSSSCRRNVASRAGGWMSKKYSCRSGGEKCFSLNIPFNRTSPLINRTFRSCEISRLNRETLGRLAGLVFKVWPTISVRRREATGKRASWAHLESWPTRIDHLQLPSVFRDNLRSHLPVDAAG